MSLEDRLLSLPTLLGLMKEPHGSLFEQVNIVPALDGFEVDIEVQNYSSSCS